MHEVTDSLFATLKNDGGFTIHVHSGDSPAAGEKKFAVAFSKLTERTFPLANFSPVDLVHFIADNRDVLAFPGVYLGAWIDGGTVYLDCSLVTSDETEAFRLADENDQLAIFAFEDMSSKYLPRELGEAIAA